jgi:hypothetical protein
VIRGRIVTAVAVVLRVLNGKLGNLDQFDAGDQTLA